MKTTFISALQKIINAYLSLDEQSKDRFQDLHDKVITIELLPLKISFQLSFNKEGVTLYSGEEIPADCKLSGTPLQMLGAMLTKENRHAFFADDLKIEGDATVAGLVTRLFDELEIDWEELLSQVIGDAPSYHLIQKGKRLKSFLKETKNRIAADISEYLHEEIDLFPEREALEDFFSDIDELRMDTDRMHAKFTQLKEKVSQHENH